MDDKWYLIPGPWLGRLGIVSRPRGGDWLEDDIRDWARLGLNVVVSLLTPEEIAEFELTGQEDLCRANEIEYINLPVPDRDIPASRESVLEVVAQLENHLSSGKKVGIHCRQGIGRSGVLAACLLVSGGISPDSAFGQISESRGRPVPETPEQRTWVESFAPQLARHSY